MEQATPTAQLQPPANVFPPRNNSSRRATQAIGAALLLHAMAFAQEVRHFGHPEIATTCFDRTRDVLVGFGVSGYGYEWDGSQWHRTPDLGASRIDACWFDAASGRITAVTRPPTGSGVMVRERVGNQWQTLYPAGPGTPDPSRRFVYDHARAQILAFGSSSLNPFDNTTRIFDGTGWSQVQTATAPPPLWRPILAYDELRQRVVLFGGRGPGGSLNDTWEWDGTDWTQIAAATLPATTADSHGVYDANLQRVLLFANTQSFGIEAFEVWAYDGATWTLLPAPPGALAGRWVTAVGHDAARARTLIANSSQQGRSLSDTWAFDGTTWTFASSFDEASPWVGGPAVSREPGSGAVMKFGGFSPFIPTQWPATNELWRFDGNQWQFQALGTVPARALHVMVSMPTGTFVFGGADATGQLLGDTWQWSGGAWSSVTSTPAPSPRGQAAMAVHEGTGRAVLFGGSVNVGIGIPRPPLSDTWTFDGSNWQLESPTTQPSARWDHLMAYDSLRDRVVMFGGSTGSTGPAQTWEWDGANWNQVATATNPPGYGSMAFDTSLQRVVLATTGGAGATFWTYDGSDWQARPTTGGSAEFPLEEPVYPAVTGFDGRATFIYRGGQAQLLASPARVDTIPSLLCTTPVVAASHLPSSGESMLELEVTAAPANAPVLLVGANASANVPVLGCTLLVALGQAAALTTATQSGFARVPLPIPASPQLVGASLWFQAATTSAAAPSGIRLGPAIELRIGQ